MEAAAPARASQVVRAKRPRTAAAQIDIAKPPRRRRRTCRRRTDDPKLLPMPRPNCNWGAKRARTTVRSTSSIFFTAAITACDSDLICSRPRSSCRNRDWANLTDGPAGLIADHVLAHDVAGYVRFRAVCRSWRRCSADPRAHGGLDRRFHPRRWTMLREELAAPDRRSFLNTSTGQCVQVHIPELHDHDLLALTPEGLLVLVHKPRRSTVRLLNPLTRHLTELPPLTTLLPPKHHDKLYQYEIHSYCPAWGSGIAEDDSTVVLCFDSLSMIGVARPGDDHWTLLKYNGD